MKMTKTRRRRVLGEVGSLAVAMLWQRGLGPRYNRRKNIICRFHPSCSQYARLAMERHGLVRGIRLTRNRLSRCVPHNTATTIDYP